MIERLGGNAVRQPRSPKAAVARAKAASFLYDLPKLHVLSTSWLFVIGALFLMVRWQPVQDAAAAIAPVVFSQQTLVEPIVAEDSDVRLLAATVWAEARSEGEKGMRAVAHVMYNRMGDRFGEDIEDVVLAPRQFSAWNVGDPNRPLALNPERYARGGINKTTWEQALRISREVLERRSVDPTHGALFYHTRAVRPSWARYGIGKRAIGTHVFYADVPDRSRRRPWNAPNALVAQVQATGPSTPAAVQHAETPALAARAEPPAVQQVSNGRVQGVLPNSI